MKALAVCLHTKVACTKYSMSKGTDRQTDGQTDRRTDGKAETYIPPFHGG